MSKWSLQILPQGIPLQSYPMRRCQSPRVPNPHRVKESSWTKVRTETLVIRLIEVLECFIFRDLHSTINCLLWLTLKRIHNSVLAMRVLIYSIDSTPYPLSRTIRDDMQHSTKFNNQWRSKTKSLGLNLICYFINSSLFFLTHAISVAAIAVLKELKNWKRNWRRYLRHNPKPKCRWRGHLIIFI